MSTLILEEITTSNLEQVIRVSNNASCAVLRLHLYKHGTPTGNLVIKLLSGATVLKTITTDYSTMNAEIAESYGHGLFKFDLDFPLKKDGAYTEYTIQLSSSAYDSSNYYGWVKDWYPSYSDLYGTGSLSSGNTIKDTLKPFHFELYEYK